MSKDWSTIKTARLEALKAVAELIMHTSHMCSGRDCIGYLIHLDSASQYQCNSCNNMFDKLAALREAEDD